MGEIETTNGRTETVMLFYYFETDSHGQEGCGVTLCHQVKGA